MLLVQLVACAAVCGAGETVLLDFSAAWCGPCRSMEPVVRRLASEGRPVRQIDIDQNPGLAKEFGVSGVPCFVMLCDGTEVDRVEGATSYTRLTRMFEVAAEQSPPAAATGTGPQVIPTSAVAEGNGDPSSSNVSPVESAYRATVRLKIEDAGGVSYGTGTIIDSHKDEALVLTCGHLFRASQGKGRLSADLFVDGRPQTSTAQVVLYDLERDLGLVSVRPTGAVEPARVAPTRYSAGLNMKVFSIGCDRGAAPTVQHTHVTAIDRYMGTPNIEAHGAPEVGRSGGGLFDSQGNLIGVCNGAQKEDNEGVFASFRAVHAMLDSVRLARVYQNEADPNLIAREQSPRDQGLVDKVGSARRDESIAEAYEGRDRQTIESQGRPAGFDYTRRRGQSPKGRAVAQQNQAGSSTFASALDKRASLPEMVPVAAAPGRFASPASAEPLARFASHAAAEDTEVICIVRPRGNPSVESKVIVLSQPSRQFLDQMTLEAAATAPRSAGPHSLQAARPASLEERSPADFTPPAWPAIRAQSPE